MKQERVKKSLMGVASGVREELRGAGEMRVTEGVVVTSRVAALVLSFPAELLERVGVLSVPKGGGEVEVVVSRERAEFVKRALGWCMEDEVAQRPVLEKLYEAIYVLVQAHVAEVDVREVLRMGGRGEVIRAAAEFFSSF